MTFKTETEKEEDEKHTITQLGLLFHGLYAKLELCVLR